MSFKVRLFLGAPDFETLHVAKLREYPLEPRDYKPYAQARICFAADGLHVQLLSFESKPLPQSEVRAVFALTPGAPPLIVSLRADGFFGARRAQYPLRPHKTRTPLHHAEACGSHRSKRALSRFTNARSRRCTARWCGRR